MNRQTRREIQITAELIGRTLHPLDELERPYVLLLADMNVMFTNVDKAYAAAIIRKQFLINDKIEDCEVENEAMKQTAIPKSEKDR
jgi:hypothetical protein